MTWSRSIACLLVAGLAAATPTRMSVEELLRFLAEASATDLNDEDAAKELAGFELTQRLPEEPIEALKRMGAGPAALAALDRLRLASATLPPDSSPGPAPDDAQWKALTGNVTSYAEGYVRALPNFLCVQTTLYYKGAKREQKVVEDLRYHDGGEDYQTRLVNGKPSTAPVTEIRSVYTRGEFGSILSETFSSASQPQFQWDHWETIQGKRVAVIAYRVERAHSSYRICCVSLGTVTVNGVRHPRRKEEVTAYRGFIYADPDTGVIERLTLQNFDIPVGLNLDDARNLIEYQPVTIGEKTAWLPARAIHFNRQGADRTHSVIAFSDFRSFGAKLTIQFPGEDR